MAFGDSDLPIFFSDFAVAVSFNGQTAKGTLDTDSNPIQHGNGPGGLGTKKYLLRIPANAFTTTPAELAAIAVDGVSYTVKSLPPQLDSSVLELLLKPGAL